MPGKIRKKATIFYSIFWSLFVCVKSLDPSQCIAPLGMENGMIKDREITVSSSFDYENVGPHHGRIRSELNGGAWCPQTQATSETKEWIEIDLRVVHMITAAEVQGRFGNGQGVEFAEAYVLEYFRPRLNKWIRYQTRKSGIVLKGNVNTYLEEKTILDPPIWASKIRFLPYSSHKRTVCMRVEIYGCRWSDGIVSYSMPQGDKRGASWEFYDFTYDGQWDGERLKYGLGQLVDTQIAPDDFKLPFREKSTQGWIGWKNDIRQSKHVEITFEFDKIREFSAVHIFVNNQFTKEIQVFSVVKVFFSTDGKKYMGEPISYEIIEDKIFENSRNVSVKLHHRFGSYVKLQLYFAARWMLISEISFESFPILGNITQDEHEGEVYKEEVKIQRDQNVINTKIENTTPVNNFSELRHYLGITVGILGIMVIFTVAIVMYVVIQQKRYKDPSRTSQIMEKTNIYKAPSLDHVNIHPDYADIKDPEYAIPLQTTESHKTFLNMKNFHPKPSTTPPSNFERSRAATEICRPQYTPLSPPLCTLPPVQLQRQPRGFIDKMCTES